MTGQRAPGHTYETRRSIFLNLADGRIGSFGASRPHRPPHSAPRRLRAPVPEVNRWSTTGFAPSVMPCGERPVEDVVEVVGLFGADFGAQHSEVLQNRHERGDSVQAPREARWAPWPPAGVRWTAPRPAPLTGAAGRTSFSWPSNRLPEPVPAPKPVARRWLVINVRHLCTGSGQRPPERFHCRYRKM
jgi:hypothetical protein